MVRNELFDERLSDMKQLSFVDSNLYLHSADGSSVIVQAYPCFPWSEPSQYISLRDFENKELVLVADPSLLDEDSRSALESGLGGSGFVFRIQRIVSVEVEFEIRNWIVTTEQGERSFQTRLDEWPRTMPGGGFQLRDVAGDIFYVPPLKELDVRSRDVLSDYVD
jgi:hypothetical protein